MNETIIKFALPVVIVAMLAVAVFGFSLMNEPGGTMVGCFGAGPNCSLLGPIEHFQIHLNTFKSVSTAIANAFATFMLLFFVVALYFSSKLRVDNDGGGSAAFKQHTEPPLQPTESFVRWLALHEKRDPSSLYAMNA